MIFYSLTSLIFYIILLFMTGLLFGTAGIPRSAKKDGVLGGLARIKELGLDAMELEFVRGVNMSPDQARLVNIARKELGVRLSVHAPYFINFNAREKYKRTASVNRIMDSARIGALAGATGVVFHAGFYLGDPAKKVYQVIKKEIRPIIQQLKRKKINITLRPELTGKASQFGSLDEVLRLAKELKDISFCFDVSHLHARHAGKYNTAVEYERVIKKIRRSLGVRALSQMHFHLSGIHYTAKGERNHLNLKDSDFNYRDWLKVLKRNQVSGVVICESPNLEDDALLLKRTYEKL